MRTFKQHLNEISKYTLGSYIKKAAVDASSKERLATNAVNGKKLPHSSTDYEKAADKRFKGIRKATDKLTGRKYDEYYSEETIIEKLAPDAKAGDYIDDFVHSKNKMFKGDSKKQRIKRALGAYYGKKNEEVELIDTEETLIEKYEGMEHMSDAAHELVLHADNDSHLHHSSHMPIINNLKKKAKKGVYDPEKAKKLWGYHADRAAQNYHKHYGDKSQPWHKMFTPSDRKQAATHWEAHHRDEVHEKS